MIRCEVADEHGEAVVYVDETVLDRLTARQRAAVAQLVAELPVEQRAREHMLAILVRQVADHDAYKRVCAERGLLPCCCHDLIVHASGTGPGGGQIRVPQRARRAHSYLLIFSRPGAPRRPGLSAEEASS